MPDASPTIGLRVVESLSAVDADQWGVQPDKGFEVAMKEDERLQYIIYRSDRDVVRKTTRPVELDKDGKPKPPFADRVLNKAVEHLRQQIDKAPPGQTKAAA